MLSLLRRRQCTSGRRGSLLSSKVALRCVDWTWREIMARLLTDKIALRISILDARWRSPARPRAATGRYSTTRLLIAFDDSCHVLAGLFPLAGHLYFNDWTETHHSIVSCSAAAQVWNWVCWDCGGSSVTLLRTRVIHGRPHGVACWCLSLPSCQGIPC